MPDEQMSRTDLNADQGIQTRVDALDVTLFDEIASQTTFRDRQSLLALHAACRSSYETFAYLEIGSHRGGSLQALIRDPHCDQVISIDARPERQPDERGREYIYKENSTAAMIRGLSELPGADSGKLKPIHGSTSAIDPDSLDRCPRLSFIDGEHTDAAAIRDAKFCSTVMAGEGAIAFHDAQIVYRGIAEFLRLLSHEGVRAHPYLLPDSIVVIELGEVKLFNARQVRLQLEQNVHGYLFGLHFNDGYRKALNRPLGRLLRRVRFLNVDGVDDLSAIAD